MASLEPEQKEYREAYGVDRLYFVVSAKGNKRWEFRYKRTEGKWSWVGLGTYPDFSAKRAREKAADNIKLVDGGIDSVQHKQ
ncbi:Arm DNA-binding domain-containing protein [Pseudomonas amygdali pv. lachrymans]|nr:Arm DNA-binding domain-containing protein [Pseudomonas amygdali]WIO60934.1 Arm DNA-binding domain-containing protein [Pseudomonas amygdali pv. lachrymans]